MVEVFLCNSNIVASIEITAAVVVVQSWLAASCGPDERGNRPMEIRSVLVLAARGQLQTIQREYIPARHSRLPDSRKGKSVDGTEVLTMASVWMFAVCHWILRPDLEDCHCDDIIAGRGMFTVPSCQLQLTLVQPRLP